MFYKILLPIATMFFAISTYEVVKIHKDNFQAYGENYDFEMFAKWQVILVIAIIATVSAIITPILLALKDWSER